MSPDRDDDIREMLRRRADAMTPRGTYGDLERRLASEGVARPWQRPVLAGVAAVFALLLGVGVIALATDQPDTEQVDTTDVPATDDGSTTSSPSTGPPESTVAPPPETTATAPQTTVTSAVATTTAVPRTSPTTPAPPTTAPPTTAPPTTADPTTTAAPPTTLPTTPATPPATSPLTDDTRVSLRGIGSLSLPLAKADVTAATGQRLLDDGVAPGGTSCGYVTPEGGPSGLSLMTNGDRVVRVDVHDNSAVRTMSDIGIGTSQAEVSAAYPGAVIRPGKYSGLDIIVTDASAPDHGLIFQVLDGKVLAYRSGLTEFVNYIEGCS